MSRPAHHRIGVSLMKTPALSESMRVIGSGIDRPTAPSPSTSGGCSLVGSWNGPGPTGADFGGHLAVDDGPNQAAAAVGYQGRFPGIPAAGGPTRREYGLALCTSRTGSIFNTAGNPRSP